MKRILTTVVALAALAFPASASASTLTQFDVLHLHGAPPKMPARVGIIDTGVDARSPLLGGRVVVRQGNGAAGANSHGSLIATAITGGWLANGTTNTGSAVGAQVDFFDCQNGVGVDVYCAEGALKWAIMLNMRVINMSFATDVQIPDDLRARFQEDIAIAESRGIVIVAASGEGNTLPFPAYLGNVLTVSSETRSGGKVNPSAWTAAPGQNIVITNSRGVYTAASGSSFAAAYTTGIVARLLSLRPGLTPREVRNLLRGRVDMARAMRRLHIKPYVVPAPRCATVRQSGHARLIRWTRVPYVTYYRVNVGGLHIIRKLAPFRTGLKGAVTVQSFGQYGMLSRPRIAKNRC